MSAPRSEAVVLACLLRADRGLSGAEAGKEEVVRLSPRRRIGAPKPPRTAAALVSAPPAPDRRCPSFLSSLPARGPPATSPGIPVPDRWH